MLLQAPVAADQAEMNKTAQPWDSLFDSSPDPGEKVGWGEDRESSSYSLAYFPVFVYSYEQESYDFTYSFELEDLQSSSHDFSETPEGVHNYLSSYDYGYSFGYTTNDDFSYNYTDTVEDTKKKDMLGPDDVRSFTTMDVRVVFIHTRSNHVFLPGFVNCLYCSCVGYKLPT